ncbi:MYB TRANSCRIPTION FACTOR MIXTA-LIKE PROTEIN [Salix purpurea]|uniref:MYB TRANSCRIPTION FACTOR MIXTA-LIKE PROTEIN n=1 Tax=Salix purpurea TaxID=77065 RepID=A0A9Q0W617_SALPP|nr:MYB TRANSCRIPTION FACTOR MIXTA-LIKE PROTEIN [Salix purpurea]
MIRSADRSKEELSGQAQLLPARPVCMVDWSYELGPRQQLDKSSAVKLLGYMDGPKPNHKNDFKKPSANLWSHRFGVMGLDQRGSKSSHVQALSSKTQPFSKARCRMHRFLPIHPDIHELLQDAVSYNYIKHATSFDLTTFLFGTPCTTSQKRQLTSIGPKLQINHSSSSYPVNMCESPSSCHMVQWESARVEAEARLSMQSLLEQEDNCKPRADVMSVSDSIGSNEFVDSSDTALKLLLDFPGGNGMEFIRENFLGSGCD